MSCIQQPESSLRRWTWRWFIISQTIAHETHMNVSAQMLIFPVGTAAPRGRNKSQTHPKHLFLTMSHPTSLQRIWLTRQWPHFKARARCVDWEFFCIEMRPLSNPPWRFEVSPMIRTLNWFTSCLIDSPSRFGFCFVLWLVLRVGSEIGLAFISSTRGLRKTKSKRKQNEHVIQKSVRRDVYDSFYMSLLGMRSTCQHTSTP